MARTAAAAKEKNPEIDVIRLEQQEATFYLYGRTAYYCNRVAEKAKRELLLPRPGRLTLAQKAENLKHDPVREFRDSAYLSRDDDAETRILTKATALKSAIGQAAIDMPTAVARAQINRLTYVTDEMVNIWGTPRMNLDVVRMADQAHTPDIRTRAKIYPWATRLTIRWTLPMLNQQKVGTLLAAAGMIVGIGDFRQEKGKGNYGLFEIVERNDPRLLAIMKNAGREVQDAAFAEPECSDWESEDLLAWYNEEIIRRANQPKPEPKTTSRRRRAKGNGEAGEEQVVN
jgi:hypothetical protein